MAGQDYLPDESFFVHQNRSSMEALKYGIGIDIAKDKFDCCLSIITNSQVVEVKAQSGFPNTPTGFDSFLKWVTKLRKLQHLPVVYLMEATGVYYEQLAWYLHTKECAVSVVLPNKAKKYKESLGLRSKNDRIDARGLAQMICERAHICWQPLSKSLYTLRLITRQIESISVQGNRHLEQPSCTYPRHVSGYGGRADVQKTAGTARYAKESLTT